MIDATVPTGAQPRDLVLEVITDTFDGVMALADAGNVPPQLDPSIERARRAQARDCVGELDQYLREVAIAALATRVRLRAAATPEDFTP